MKIEILTSPDTMMYREKALSALPKAQQIEKERKKKGWKYVHINNNTKILVPCDKDGNPTKEGQEKINRFKEHLLSI